MDENNGLVFSYILDGAGGGRPISWEDVEKWIPEDGLLWLHLNYRNERVQKWLSEASGLNPIICEALLEEETRPRTVAYDDGFLLILRGVNCNPGSDPEDMVSLRMWFDKGRIISMRQRRVMAIDDINKAIDNQFSACPKCLDSIFIYPPGMMISTGNSQPLKHGSIEDKA
jgi:zinc transporter